MSKHTCTAFIAGNGRWGLCRNGFPQTPACDPVKPEAIDYEKPETILGSKVPLCCNEKWCGEAYAATGGRPLP